MIHRSTIDYSAYRKDDGIGRPCMFQLPAGMTSESESHVAVRHRQLGVDRETRGGKHINVVCGIGM